MKGPPRKVHLEVHVGGRKPWGTWGNPDPEAVWPWGISHTKSSQEGPWDQRAPGPLNMTKLGPEKLELDTDCSLSYTEERD